MRVLSVVVLVSGGLGALGLVRNRATIQGSQACDASANSMTPRSWVAPAVAATPAPKAGLRLMREIPLPGPANRFDYQSLDATTRRLYINHMNAGRTVVFDVDKGRVLAEIGGVPRATGVWAVPSHHQVYISAAGAHEVAVVDDRTLKITARVSGIRFPDGIAHAPVADKVFVSDESGGTDVVIDAVTPLENVNGNPLLRVYEPVQ